MPNVALRRPKLWLLKAVLAILFAQWLCGPMLVALADEPQSDPAGIATGDKSSTSDAGGNSFILTEPTDKTASDYAKNKKAFDDFQAQAAKEPLAVKLADNVGHLRIATNFSGRCSRDTWCSSCRPALPCSPAGWCARRTPAIS